MVESNENENSPADLHLKWLYAGKKITYDDFVVQSKGPEGLKPQDSDHSKKPQTLM
jgi:hypothetical protein